MLGLCFAGLTLSAQRNSVTARVSRKSAKHVAPAMQLKTTGRISLYSGIGILTAVLTNRLMFSSLDALTLAQSRSDILGVISGATLLLYGIGKAEVTDSKQAVELSGVDVRKGFEDVSCNQVANEVEWAALALLSAIPNVKSYAVFVDGVGRFFLGRFRNSDVASNILAGGVLELALRKGERAYLADMKTVPVKDVEFSFLPSNCQAVIVQPISEKAVIVLGADKPRPFMGGDFGWLQAVSDRLAAVMSETDTESRAS